MFHVPHDNTWKELPTKKNNFQKNRRLPENFVITINNNLDDKFQIYSLLEKYSFITKTKLSIENISNDFIVEKQLKKIYNIFSKIKLESRPSFLIKTKKIIV